MKNPIIVFFGVLLASQDALAQESASRVSSDQTKCESSGAKFHPDLGEYSCHCGGDFVHTLSKACSNLPEKGDFCALRSECNPPSDKRHLTEEDFDTPLLDICLFSGGSREDDGKGGKECVCSGTYVLANSEICSDYRDRDGQINVGGCLDIWQCRQAKSDAERERNKPVQYHMTCHPSRDSLPPFGRPQLADPKGVKDKPACKDGIDNDGDGLIDAKDPGCAGKVKFREDPQCNDGIDNDWDGWIDTEDKDCRRPSDQTEYPLLPGKTQTDCNNGWDDDGDGWYDLGDPGCTSALDTDEREPVYESIGNKSSL